MQKVILYTKLDCSLCDKAYQILLEIAFDRPLEIDIIDITFGQRKLETNYKDRIPVISLPQAGRELNWPFTSRDVIRYLK